MKKTGFLPFILFFLISCVNSQSVTKRRLKCNHPITNGFSISKITVSKVGDNGIPITYKADTTIECAPNYCASSKELKEKLTLVEYNLYQSASDTLDLIYKRNNTNNVLEIGKLSSTDFNNYFDAERIKDSIIKLRFPFHPKRKIYLNKENKNYKWFVSLPAGGETTYLFPLEFQKNSWYKINQLGGYGFFSMDCDFFIYIDSKGRMHEWHVCEKWSPV